MPYNRDHIPDAPLPVSMMPRVAGQSLTLNDLLYLVQPGNNPGQRSKSLDPFARNCDKIEDRDDYTRTDGRWLSATELAKVTSKRISNCPIKFFLGTADTTTPAYPSQIVYKQLKNAGQFVACNLYSGIGHCVDQNAPVIGTFEYRGNTFNVTQPTIDMVNWWARFGGYDELPEIT